MNHKALLSNALDYFTVQKSFVRITKDFTTGHLLTYLWEEKANEWVSFTPAQLKEKTLLSAEQISMGIRTLIDLDFALVRRVIEGSDTVEFQFLLDREKVIEAIAALADD